MTRRHSPTEEERRTVKALSGYGVPQEDIAIHMDMDAKTLRKHYRRELDRGTIEANAKVAQTLFTMATVDKNVAAAIFWMKARGGWREKPLPDEEPEPVKTVISWMDDGPTPPDLFPLGRKTITRDIDYE
jgi:hypothetical protein